MPESPPTLHAIDGLDGRDLALLAAACANQASFLTHLAAGRYDDSVAIQTGYHHDPHRAAYDAERLRQIAEILSHRLPANPDSRPPSLPE